MRSLAVHPAVSLIQTMGRAARHLNGRAILYADVMTDSMKQAIGETTRRREMQLAYNEANGITPESIIKAVDANLVAIAEADYWTPSLEDPGSFANTVQRDEFLARLDHEMREAAKKFEFERAAILRDKIREVKQREVLAQRA